MDENHAILSKARRLILCTWIAIQVHVLSEGPNAFAAGPREHPTIPIPPSHFSDGPRIAYHHGLSRGGYDWFSFIAGFALVIACMGAFLLVIKLMVWLLEQEYGNILMKAVQAIIGLMFAAVALWIIGGFIWAIGGWVLLLVAIAALVFYVTEERLINTLSSLDLRFRARRGADGDNAA